MSNNSRPLHLFEGYGLELEYMIVNRDTLDVAPISDWLLSQLGPAGCREVENGPLVWSNELAMHVIELKGNGPVKDISTLLAPLQRDLRQMNSLLQSQNCCLMGGAVHPWMNPDTDTRLWGFEDAPIYEALNRIFGCRGHGWFNLQSAHLNLPFADDDEFARLHGAIRLILPIIPALAAASPFLDGQDTKVADARLMVYSQHCNRLPEAIGQIIPEAILSREQYESIILSPLYAALKPKDPEGTLQYEWSNARGAIARFDRNTIEIRLIDIQEHPGMDMGVVGAVAAAVRLLTAQALDDLEKMNAISDNRLRIILDGTIQRAETTYIDDGAYLKLLTGNEAACTGAQLWRQILERCNDFNGPERDIADWILTNGTLASRMCRTTGDMSAAFLRTTASRLCNSLAESKAFD